MVLLLFPSEEKYQMMLELNFQTQMLKVRYVRLAAVLPLFLMHRWIAHKKNFPMH